MSFTERDLKVAIVAGIVAFIVAVVMLDWKGYINHASNADGAVVEEFKLVLIGEEGNFKVSPKSSNKEAFCADGYLLLRPEKSNSAKEVAGLLVDGKNRAVRCSRELPAPGK